MKNRLLFGVVLSLNLLAACGDDVDSSSSKMSHAAFPPRIPGNARMVMSPFQPSDRLKMLIGSLVRDPDATTAGSPGHVVRDGLPYFPFTQTGEDGVFSYHPMRLGVYYRNATDPVLIERTLPGSEVLPNGGRAWYYPPVYQQQRMQGPYWRYSGISQGTILAGLTVQGMTHPEMMKLAREAFVGMQYSFFDGGVNLEDKVILEMPNFLGAPELILNGWLEALIHLDVYARASSDAEAQVMLDKNIAFLSTILDLYDVPALKISRYSDLCPLLASVTFDEAEPTQMWALYIPKRAGLSPVVVPVTTLVQEKASVYDNQILQRNGKNYLVSLSFSGSYHTILIADTSFRLSVWSGRLSFRDTVPAMEGTPYSFGSYPVREGFASYLDPEGTKLVAGYPTNFSRPDQMNYYHVYHVVALMLLARYATEDDAIRKPLLEYALKWRGYIDEKPVNPPFAFFPLAKMLTEINSKEAVVHTSDYQELEQWARADLLRIVESE